MIRVEKPWGWYESLTEGHNFKVKLLYVTKGNRLSLQRHFKRSESWVVVEGHPLVIKGDTQRYMKPQESIHIMEGEVHRIEADDDDVRIIEVQQGLCDEDDIERLHDDYGRDTSGGIL